MYVTFNAAWNTTKNFDKRFSFNLKKNRLTRDLNLGPYGPQTITLPTESSY